MKILITISEDDTVMISRTRPDVRNTHSLDDSDKIKRNSAVKQILEAEAAKGYDASQIFKIWNGSHLGLHAGQRQRLVHAGGQYVDRQEILNARKKRKRGSEPDDRVALL